MSLRDKKLAPSEYYHIYNRGTWKNEIFLDDEDYDRFEKLLYLCNSEKKIIFRNLIIDSKINAFDFEKGTPLVSIIAWVLMPNHFHIILTSNRSDLWEKDLNPITEFMRKLMTAYVMYLNKKHNRKGSLFEGIFKSKYIGEENYFNYIFSYTHLNPIKLIQSDWKEKGILDKEKAEEFLKNYKHSSFQDFFGSDRKQVRIIDKDFIPDYLFKIHIKELLENFKNNT